MKLVILSWCENRRGPAPSKWEWQATSMSLLTALASLSSLGLSGPVHCEPYCIFSKCWTQAHVPLPVPWLHWDTSEAGAGSRDRAGQGQGGSEDSWAGDWQLSLGQHRQDVRSEVWCNLLWQPAQEFLLQEKGGKTKGPIWCGTKHFWLPITL